jgi:DNA polymerase IV (DinB-like DNA polymerase)
LARVIGHIDLDYFYAQVEEVQDPSIKDRPVVVCVFSGRTEDSGVISTSNYRARALSVKSGMSIVAAKKKLEGHDPVIVKMVHEKYEAVSGRVMDLVSERVDVFEKAGIDEAFFDVTMSSGEDYSAAAKIAQGIKDAILQNEGLTCSVGLGRSKVVAKLGSDSAKPGGLMTVLPESTEAFLGPLPVTRLYGVGPKTAAVLDEIGVKTAEELSQTDPALLERRFGRKLGSYLLAAASGTDDDPVLVNLEPTQFSRIVTLKQDTRDVREALGQLADGMTSLQAKLVGSGKSFRTISAIGVLTDLSTKTKSKTFDTPIKDPDLIKVSVLALFNDLVKSTDKDLRRVGVRVSELSDGMDQRSLSEFLQPGR